MKLSELLKVTSKHLTVLICTEEGSLDDTYEFRGGKEDAEEQLSKDFLAKEVQGIFIFDGKLEITVR